MSRLKPAEPHGPDLIRRYSYRTARRMYGRQLEPMQVLAHHRPLLVGVGVASMALERHSKSVDEHLKQLAMLRTSQLVGCEWCLDFGSYLAQRSGLSEDRLREISVWRESDRFEPIERLVLEYAEAMTRTPVEVSDELFEHLREHFDEPQVVELTLAIALENLYSRSNWAFGIEGQGFSEGMYCVAPERAESLGAEVGSRDSAWMARRAALRASDNDREQVADRLRHAAAEGRLLTEELEERLGAAFSARTYGDLDHVVADLPAPQEKGHETPLWVKATLALAILVAMLAVLAVVALVLIGLAGAWLVWVFIAWMCMGGGRRRGVTGHSRRQIHHYAYRTPSARGPRRRAASL